ncbi:hypothetical protein [Bremerella cremea]|uniref:hypothetical protein n=1 Tax=Bremerella cremea TaxID=1031537 RepID=UPI0031F1AE8B
MSRSSIPFFLFLALLSTSGCFGPGSVQPGASYSTVMVTMDGQPVENANITFAPVGNGRSAYGRTDAQGMAIMGTSNPGDGVFPGEYQVGVSKSEPDPEHIVHDVDAYHRKHGKFPELVMIYHTPKRYEDPASSGFSATIVADQSNELQLELTSK